MVDARSANDRAKAGNRIEHWASILVGAAVVFLAGWMTIEAAGPPHGRPIKKDLEGGTDTAPLASAGATSSASPPDAGAASADLDAGLFLSSLTFGDASLMPSNAPRNVRIGVVLVSYAGAEGAPATARSKKDALAIAERLGQEARTDFHHAVSGGDPGSADDIGRLPRGVLDPRTEVAVFALGTAEISEVLETPKGYWIVKRLE